MPQKISNSWNRAQHTKIYTKSYYNIATKIAITLNMFPNSPSQEMNKNIS